MFAITIKCKCVSLQINHCQCHCHNVVVLWKPTLNISYLEEWRKANSHPLDKAELFISNSSLSSIEVVKVRTLCIKIVSITRQEMPRSQITDHPTTLGQVWCLIVSIPDFTLLTFNMFNGVQKFHATQP